MRILLLSAEKDETTDAVLDVMKQELHSLNMECTVIYAEEDLHACTHCQKCRKKKACIFEDDCINQIINDSDQYDGLIIIGREYYERCDKNLLNLLERLCTAGRSFLALKPASVLLLSRNNTSAPSFEGVFRMLASAGLLTVSAGSLPVIYDDSPEAFKEDRLGNAVVLDLIHAMIWTVASLHGEKCEKPAFIADSIRKLIR